MKEVARPKRCERGAPISVSKADSLGDLVSAEPTSTEEAILIGVAQAVKPVFDELNEEMERVSADFAASRERLEKHHLEDEGRRAKFFAEMDGGLQDLGRLQQRCHEDALLRRQRTPIRVDEGLVGAHSDHDAALLDRGDSPRVPGSAGAKEDSQPDDVTGEIRSLVDRLKAF